MKKTNLLSENESLRKLSKSALRGARGLGFFGLGKMYYGKTLERNLTQEIYQKYISQDHADYAHSRNSDLFITTDFLTFSFIPILPLRSYLTREDRDYDFILFELQKRLFISQVINVYLAVFLIGVFLAWLD